MNYISISLYRKVVNHALAEGMAPEDFKGMPVPIESMDDIQAVPADQFFELHEMLDHALGPGFSVRVGQQMKMDDYGVLGLSWKTCSKAGEIFERCERYFHLLSNTYVFKVEKEGEISKVHLFRDAHRRGVELSNEATFSATVVVLQAMTETDMAPVGVSFKHGAPESLESYHEAFKCPILFDQPQNYIAYKTTDLETRTAKADFSINKFLVERVEEKTRGIEISSNIIVSDVESLIKDALPSGIPSIIQIGEHMGMSSRTLTRRLSEDGITFRGLVRQTQERMAKGLLRNSSDTVSEIAFQTGFSEQSAFSRAFKRWTGQSPLEYRNPR
ncbi:MAG: AraC family transcriptional regulator ligand-binding domain-containing protein [Phaeodactylibacter sp.]|nr:AraC family transcriptional regulator ligand-binding domain-containing protein [Phaeodactylibacter sp.]